MSSFSEHKQNKPWDNCQINISKHQIIQKYKYCQKQKSILKNKLNILKCQCVKNQKKSKSIQCSLKKVNRIKQNYKKTQKQIKQLLSKNRIKQEQKIASVIMRKQQSKGKLPLIKQMFYRQKSNDYLLIKKTSFDIEKRLRIYRNCVISERKNTVHKIKEQQNMTPLNRTLYLNARNRNARLHEAEESALIERKFKRSSMQLDRMRYLEESILQKLDKSRTALNKSMSKLSQNIRG